jgi:hypothetical protein
MDRPEAEKIYASGKEAAILALLELAAQKEALQTQNAQLLQRLHQLEANGSSKPSPSTPSGMIPPYEKPSASSRRRKQPGRQKGHPGSRRPPIPEEAINRTETHRLNACPHCHGPVSLLAQTRERFTEDIPVQQPELTRHIQQVGWCTTCKKKVVAVVPDVLPGATIGNRALVLTSWLHYGLGTTLSHLIQVFGAHFHFPLTPGGLIQMWLRLSQILYPWYLQICQEARASRFHRRAGTRWRGSPVLAGLFGELFSGILISDFWSAYDKLETAARQVCFVLFRELEKVAKANQNPEWLAFQKKLARFLRDSLRLDKNDSLCEIDRTTRLLRLHQRLDDLLAAPYLDPDCKRLVARLHKHREHILTFLEAGIPADNNHGEREIRPAVIIRKNSYGNKSDQGAEVQAVMMSIYRTLKLRGHDPLETITAALKHYVLTRQLPPLPV